MLIVTIEIEDIKMCFYNKIKNIPTIIWIQSQHAFSPPFMQ